MHEQQCNPLRVPYNLWNDEDLKQVNTKLGNHALEGMNMHL